MYLSIFKHVITCLDMLKIVQTVVLNIVETVAALLINNDLVGSELENFTFEYTKEFNSNLTVFRQLIQIFSMVK